MRLRIDGVMHEVQTIPKLVHAAMVARIKVMARMDIAEKRRPQDGRIKTERQDKEIELRVSTLPVAFGEKMVIRIFDPEITASKLEGLGFFPREQELFESFVAQPHGIVLVTGPTGSGKTTTLYSALRMLADGETNIVTIEDPIEMVTEEFNQTAVSPVIGLTFASALRTPPAGPGRDHGRRDPRPGDAQNAVQRRSPGTGLLVAAHERRVEQRHAAARSGVEPFLIAAWSA